jgi:hypothetical protein
MRRISRNKLRTGGVAVVVLCILEAIASSCGVGETGQPGTDGGSHEGESSNAEGASKDTKGHDAAPDTPEGDARPGADVDADAADGLAEADADAADGLAEANVDAADADAVTPETGTGIDADAADGLVDADAADSLLDLDASDGEAGTAVSTGQILSSLGGPGCLSCASASNDVTSSCLALYNCESLAGELSEAGQPREVLCFQTLECILNAGSTCDPAVTTCFCGSASTEGCVTSAAANGLCLQAEQNGLETTNPLDVIINFYSTSLGGGVANSLARCLIANNCSCFE